MGVGDPLASLPLFFFGASLASRRLNFFVGLPTICATRRSDGFKSGICHRIRVGRAGGRTETLLESAK